MIKKLSTAGAKNKNTPGNVEQFLLPVFLCNFLQTTTSSLRGNIVKKWIFMSLGAFICFLSFKYFIQYTIPLTQYGVIASNWDIKIPAGAEITDIIVREPSFLGDGEYFTKFQYKKPVDMSESGLTELKAKDVATANEKITEFTTTISIHNQDEAIVNAFRKHNIKAEVGDYYRYVTREGTHDYLILLYKAETNALYLYVWHI